MSNVLELLKTTSYADLFERLDPHAQRAILSRPGARDDLRRIAEDAAERPALRFLASEMLYLAKAPGWPSPEAKGALPDVYARALAASDDGGAWGLPGMWTHPATDHLIAMGRGALASLLPLFGDEKRLRYTGSKRSTLGELYRIRVKDVAALIAARILGVPYTLEESVDRRDAFIRDLAARIGA